MMKSLLSIDLELPCPVLVQETHDRLAGDDPLAPHIRTIDESSVLDIPDNSSLAAPEEVGGFGDCPVFFLGHCPGLSSLFIRSSSVSTRLAKSEEACLS